MIVKIPPEAKGKFLIKYLTDNGFKVRADCGGKGRCKKCGVRVISGSFIDSVTKNALIPDEKDIILSCRAVCDGNPAEIELENTNTHNTSSKYSIEAYVNTEYLAAAFDIGTTTLEAALVDKRDCKIIIKERRLNPQSSWGADVISRIQACVDGNLALLRDAVRGEMNDMLMSMLKRIGLSGQKIGEAVVVGNTAMLHIFCGVSPASIGVYPFTPEFLASQALAGADIGIDANLIITLPCISAYVGADVTAGMIAAKMDRPNRPTPALLIDVGTNGEMVLDTSNEYIVTSTAAGPALEGAHISCGIGAVPGAINHVDFKNGQFTFKTIQSEDGSLSPVRGVCGSGLIEWIALLLENEVIDCTGRLTGPAALCNNVSLTEKDVREYQLAKSAIRAGIETLVSSAGLNIKDINRVYIAGALGFHINMQAAVVTGLLPQEFIGKIYPIGNSALDGAVLCICKKQVLETAKSLADGCRMLELSNSKMFSDLFIEYMLF